MPTKARKKLNEKPPSRTTKVNNPRGKRKASPVSSRGGYSEDELDKSVKRVCILDDEATHDEPLKNRRQPVSQDATARDIGLLTRHTRAQPQTIDLTKSSSDLRNIRKPIRAPLGNFPRYNEGVVYIQINKSDATYNYQFESSRLIEVSAWFKHTMTLTVEEPDYLQASKIKQCMYMFRYELVHNKELNFWVLERFPLTKSNSQDATKSQVEFEKTREFRLWPLPPVSTSNIQNCASGAISLYERHVATHDTQNIPQVDGTSDEDIAMDNSQAVSSITYLATINQHTPDTSHSHDNVSEGDVAGNLRPQHGKDLEELNASHKMKYEPVGPQITLVDEVNLDKEYGHQQEYDQAQDTKHDVDDSWSYFEELINFPPDYFTSENLVEVSQGDRSLSGCTSVDQITSHKDTPRGNNGGLSPGNTEATKEKYHPLLIEEDDKLSYHNGRAVSLEPTKPSEKVSNAEGTKDSEECRHFTSPVVLFEREKPIKYKSSSTEPFVLDQFHWKSRKVLQARESQDGITQDIQDVQQTQCDVSVQESDILGNNILDAHSAEDSATFQGTTKSGDASTEIALVAYQPEIIESQETFKLSEIIKIEKQGSPSTEAQETRVPMTAPGLAECAVESTPQVMNVANIPEKVIDKDEELPVSPNTRSNMNGGKFEVVIYKDKKAPVSVDEKQNPTLLSECDVPFEICEAYNNLFSILHHITHKIDSSDVNIALRQIEVMTQAANYHGLESVVRPTARSILQDFGRRIYVAILHDPPRWLRIAYFIHSPIIFKEAMVHLVGQYPCWPWESASESSLPRNVYDLLHRKVKELSELKKSIDDKIIRSAVFIDGESVNFSNLSKDNYAGFHLVAYFRDWFINNICHIEQHDYEAAPLYRLLQTGGDAYMPFNEVIESFRNLGDGLVHYQPALVEQDLDSLKAFVRQKVQPLCINNSNLDDLKKHNIEHFTCINIDDQDLPWWPLSST